MRTNVFGFLYYCAVNGGLNYYNRETFEYHIVSVDNNINVNVYKQINDTISLKINCLGKPYNTKDGFSNFQRQY